MNPKFKEPRYSPGPVPIQICSYTKDIKEHNNIQKLNGNKFNKRSK